MLMHRELLLHHLSSQHPFRVYVNYNSIWEFLKAHSGYSEIDPVLFGCFGAIHITRIVRFIE